MQLSSYTTRQLRNALKRTSEGIARVSARLLAGEDSPALHECLNVYRKAEEAYGQELLLRGVILPGAH